MESIIARINEFLFDFLGLFLPGFLAVFLLGMPFLCLQWEAMDDGHPAAILLKNGRSLMALAGEHYGLFIAALVLLAYIAGHGIKVLSKVQYNLFEGLFNELLGTWGQRLLAKLPRLASFFRKLTKWPFTSEIIHILRGIFSFRTQSYHPSMQYYWSRTNDLLREKIDPEFSGEWHAFYKLSDAIVAQEQLKTRAYFYLAKYNFYRSLAFLFLANFLYLIWLGRSCGEWLPQGFAPTAYVINFLLWFTFHEKYKRYWLLCGNEALLAAYYFLVRQKPSAAPSPRHPKRLGA